MVLARYDPLLDKLRVKDDHGQYSRTDGTRNITGPQIFEDAISVDTINSYSLNGITITDKVLVSVKDSDAFVVEDPDYVGSAIFTIDTVTGLLHFRGKYGVDGGDNAVGGGANFQGGDGGAGGDGDFQDRGGAGGGMNFIAGYGGDAGTNSILSSDAGQGGGVNFWSGQGGDSDYSDSDAGESGFVWFSTGAGGDHNDGGDGANAGDIRFSTGVGGSGNTAGLNGKIHFLIGGTTVMTLLADQSGVDMNTKNIVNVGTATVEKLNVQDRDILSYIYFNA